MSTPAMRKKILVADDSLTIRQMVSAALEIEGFETLEAIDGRDALAKLLERREIVLVICDVNMPHLTGLEVVAGARAAGSDVPFVMLSTDGKPELLQRGKRLGVAGWIVKPVRPPTLAAAVKSLLGAR